MQDLEFISGAFFDYDIPRDKRYLLKYFTTELQAAFLKYCLFNEGETRLFRDHTGHYCSDRLRFRLLHRFRHLIKLHEEARKSLTEAGLEQLQLLESGQYPLTRSEFS